MKRDIIRIIAVLLTVILAAGCIGGTTTTSNPDNTPGGSVNSTKRPQGEVGIFAAIGSGDKIPVGLPDADYVSGINKFSIEVLRQLGDDWTGVVSPLSIQLALQLTANGANAELAAEIIGLIYSDTKSIDEANQNAAKLLCALAIEENTPLAQKNKGGNAAFNITNAIVADYNLEFEDEYEQKAGKYFNAFIASLDFEDKEGSLKKLNEWIEGKTHGLIGNMLSELPDNTAAVIVNTIYFNDEWNIPFNAFKTPTTFHGKNGDSQVTMLKSSADYELIDAENSTAVLLPYASGQYYMAVVLPDEGTLPVDALADILDRLIENDSKLTDAISGTKQKVRVTVTMPAVQLKSDMNVVEIVENMGVRSLTLRDAISTMVKNNPLTIADVLHSASLNVTEKGTEAGAATVVITNEKAAVDVGIEFTCDRPYAMAIVNAETGAAVFVSIVNDITA